MLISLLIQLLISLFGVYTHSLDVKQRITEEIDLNPLRYYFLETAPDVDIFQMVDGEFDEQLIERFDENIFVKKKRPIVWLKIPLDVSQQKNDWVINWNYPSIYRLDLYVVNHEGFILEHLVKSVEKRFDNDFQFNLSVPTVPLHNFNQEKVDLYMKIESRSYLMGKPSIFTRDSFMNQIFINRLGIGIFYGFFLLLILYNLLIFSFTKSRAFFLLGVQTLLEWLVVINLDGVFNHHISFVVVLLNGFQITYLLLILMIITFLYGDEYLKLKSYLPQWHRTFRLVIISLTISLLISFFFPHQVLVLILYFIPLILLIFLGASIKSFKFISQGKIYLLGNLILSIFIFYWWLIMQNKIEYKEYYNLSLHIGFISQAVCITIAITLNFIQLKDELKRRDEVLKKEKEKKREVTEKNAKLEELVSHRTEELVDQNKKLQKANNDLDTLIYSVSHDLKAPLASIKGLISIMDQEEEVEKLKECLVLQTKSVNKLEGFIQDILEMSRSKQGELHLEEVNVVKMVNSIYEDLQFLEGIEQIKFSNNLSNDFSKVHTDATRLKATLSNLISNAVRYADFNKQEPFIEIDGSKNGEEYQLSVKDNGIGISQEYLDKIFEMFYRANDTKEGSGLGLYIALKSMEKLGGDLRVKSTEYQGSTFTLSLPAQPQKES